MARDLTQAEAYAVRWFKKEGYEYSLQKASNNNTLFKVSRNGKETIVEVPYAMANPGKYFSYVRELLKYKLG